ncbi:MAG: hypothetical protein ACQERN_11980 [Thermodesulfobacteriota bacterium]
MKKRLLLVLLLAGLLCFPASIVFAADGIDIGGALRYSYEYKDYDEGNKDKGGDFAFDTFRLNLDGEISEMILSAEYRFYPSQNWNSIHHGWVGYDFTENWQGQVGVHQVPFGIQPFASHSFWFSGQYYLGLEDDYDLGLKALYNDGPLDLAFAFYKNGELGNAGDPGRYSIDVLNAGDVAAGNEETNQGNVRAAYTFTHSDNASTEFGISGQYGQIYNSNTDDSGDHYAGAVHMVGNYGPWNIQLEGIQYEYDAENPVGSNDDTIVVGGYESPWEIPSEAMVGTFNISYGLPVDIGPIDKLTFYSDNTLIEPDEDNFEGSMQNVVGCMVASGPVYTYFDVISAENMPFSGGSMVETDTSDRNTRININVGYYF